MPRPLTQPLSLLSRLLAAGCAALVLALTIVAASPAAHTWLHTVEQHHTCPHHPEPEALPQAHDHAHECAVVLFASSAEVPVEPLALTPPRLLAIGVSPVTAADIFLVSPRYLRQPERGPPVSRIG
jgi:hypothetical protein